MLYELREFYPRGISTKLYRPTARQRRRQRERYVESLLRQSLRPEGEIKEFLYFDLTLLVWLFIVSSDVRGIDAV